MEDEVKFGQSAGSIHLALDGMVLDFLNFLPELPS